MSSTNTPISDAEPLDNSSTVAPHAKFVRDEIRLFDGAISLVIGAVAAIAVLTALGFSAREIWSNFQESGSNIFRGLAISAVAGGLAAAAAYYAVVKRPTNAPSSASLRLLSPAACALGWGILGLSMHLSKTSFLTYLPQEIRNSRDVMAIASSIFLNNGAWQALSVALGLLLSTIVSWVIERRFFTPKTVFAPTKRGQKSGEVAATSTRDADNLQPGQALPAFSRNMSLPLLVAIPGFVLLCVLGLAVHLLPQPNAAQLPSTIGRASLSALVCALSFGVAAFAVRRSFGGHGRENSLAYVLAAPIVIAFVCAIFLGARGQMPIIESAVNTIWNASPFEAASWGAFGSALGFWLAGRKTV